MFLASRSRIADATPILELLNSHVAHPFWSFVSSWENNVDYSNESRLLQSDSQATSVQYYDHIYS